MLLRQLEYLQLVITHGSFARAAAAAGVSQPAISMAMQGLEHELGFALFRKAGRQKIPTAAALLAAERAAELHGRLGRLADLGRRNAGTWTLGRDARVLKAGLAPAAALLYGPVIEREWRSVEPDGLLQIVAGRSAADLLAALQDGELDLAIVPRPRRHQAAGLRRAAVHISLPTIYARRDHPLVNAGSLEAIAQAGWAVTGGAGTAGNVIEEAHRVRRLAPPRVLVQCADYPTLLNLVAQTDLLCVVPHPVLVPQAHELGIAPLHILEGLPRYEVSLFWPAQRQARHARAIAAIVAALKSVREPAAGVPAID